MKRMLCLLCALALLSGCGAVRESSSGRSIQDSAGRSVTVPDEITRVAPSGAVAQMILVTLAPELLAGVSKQPDEAAMAYLPDMLGELDAFGQLYGSRGDLNREALIAASPQLIVDMGNQKAHMAEDLDAVQAQTGIPTIFIEASLESLPAAYRTLGELLGKQDEAETLATYIDDALALCRENRAKIPEEKRRTVAFGTGPEGLACNAAGSLQAEVIDLVGGINAVVVPEIQNRNGGNEISMEQMYLFDPDVLLLSAEGAYDRIGSDARWQPLRAVQAGQCYEVPSLPYSWMANPPAVNRVLGLYWLGHLLYPSVYDYDMVEKTREFYRLFWHYDLSEEEARALLSRAGGG